MTTPLLFLFLALASPAPATGCPAPAEPGLAAIADAVSETASFRGFRYNRNVLAGIATARGLDADAILTAALALDDGNRYLRRSELDAAAASLAVSGGEEFIELGDLSPADARAELTNRFPNLNLDALLEESKEIVENREGTLTDPLRFGSLRKLPTGRWEITVAGIFDYEGTEFSFYATFEGTHSAGFSLTDSGAD